YAHLAVACHAGGPGRTGTSVGGAIVPATDRCNPKTHVGHGGTYRPPPPGHAEDITAPAVPRRAPARAPRSPAPPSPLDRPPLPRRSSIRTLQVSGCGSPCVPVMEMT